MPGMPFHLEKGHALNALEDLLNDDANYAALRSLWDDVRDETAPIGAAFTQALASAPTVKHYGGKAGAAGLGDYVAGAWFGQPSTSSPTPYWLDYEGDVQGIVRESLLLAIETAWGVERSAPLPHDVTSIDRSRPVRLLWHCAQRWFDAWVMWDDAKGPVTVLFATPPHTGGNIVDRIAIAESQGWATPVDRTTVSAAGDMVLVTQETNRRRRPPWLSWLPEGRIELPAIGRGTVGDGPVRAYSIHADAGGMNPRTSWS